MIDQYCMIVKIMGIVGVKDIGIGQMYNIQSWIKISVYMDFQNVDDQFFGFFNNIFCFIVFSMKDGNKFVLVYVFFDQMVFGMIFFIFIFKVVFWFQQKVEFLIMIVNFVGKNWIVSLIVGENCIIKFDKQGFWSQGV